MRGASSSEIVTVSHMRWHLQTGRTCCWESVQNLGSEDSNQTQRQAVCPEVVSCFTRAVTPLLQKEEKKGKKLASPCWLSESLQEAQISWAHPPVISRRPTEDRGSASVEEQEWGALSARSRNLTSSSPPFSLGVWLQQLALSLWAFRAQLAVWIGCFQNSMHSGPRGWSYGRAGL